MNALGDFLRNRRAELTPEQAGLPTAGARRVPGLRREEVAVLASMSIDYYVRLEQGRERRPSPQMIDALAGALQLDDDGRLHLYQLAGSVPRPLAYSTREDVDPQLLQLMAGWPDQPALVLGRAYDVLATNRIADELFAGFEPWTNLMFTMFLDPAARTFYRDWEDAARTSVAGFRLRTSSAPDDPRISEVHRELVDNSPEFATLWRRHHARGKSSVLKLIEHPEVGPLDLNMQAFDVRSAPGQELIVYHAEPGSPSAHGIALLGSIAATRDRAETERENA